MTAYTFDQIIDYTRTSAATFVANTGFVTQTPASRNRLTYTQEFDNAAWTKTNANAYPFDPAAATYGPEVISNGDFATTASWALAATAPATATIAGGKLTLVSPAGEVASANQAVLTVGKWYKVTGDVTVRSGTVKVICGGPLEYYFTATQSFTIYAQANGNTSFSLSRQGACDADFDNISVREVIGGLITAPDGTLTGDALIATAGTGITPLLNQTGTTVASTIYTASIFVRPRTHTFVQMLIGNQSADWCNFTLTGNGSVQNNGAAVGAISFDSATGYYRISMTYTAGGIDRRTAIALVTSGTATRAQTGTYAGTETIYVWGAQLEAASAASTYTRNVGGVYPPRFDYDPVTLAPRGLLIEEQRTNLLLRSEDFTTTWGAVSTTVTADTTVSPDGTADADTLTASSTGGYMQQNVTFTGDGDKAYSVFLKAGTSTTTRLTLRDTTASVNRGSVDVTWTAGVASGVATVGTLQGIDSFGNGWYRVRMLATGVVAANTNQFRFSPDPIAGTGTSIMWGAQTENGAFSTSYIPTVASQVTRTADVASVTGANFSRWYNGTAGTLVVEWMYAGSGSATAVNNRTSANISDGTASNRLQIYNISGNVGAFVGTGGVTQAALDTGSTSPVDTAIKGALAYAANDIAFVRNGGSVLTDTSATIPTVNSLTIGSEPGTARVNGWVRRIRYYPTRLSNTQLQALTA